MPLVDNIYLGDITSAQGRRYSCHVTFKFPRREPALCFKDLEWKGNPPALEFLVATLLDGLALRGDTDTVLVPANWPDEPRIDFYVPALRNLLSKVKAISEIGEWRCVWTAFDPSVPF